MMKLIDKRFVSVYDSRYYNTCVLANWKSNMLVKPDQLSSTYIEHKK